MRINLSFLITAALLAVAGIELASLAAPSQTAPNLFWDQSSYQNLAKGSLEGTSLSSDGAVRLARRLDPIQGIDSPYLWSMAEDERGNRYLAAGEPGRVYRILPDGKTSVLFQAQEPDVSAIAIDRQGRVYAATMPDGAVYRIEANGSASVFYNPNAKYIWALALDSKENLLVATGERGQVWRVNPSGMATLAFASGEAHVRSLIVASDDNVFAGTDPGGLILLIQPDGVTYVLSQSPKRQVTSLLLGSNGVLYAAAAGDKLPQIRPPQGAAGRIVDIVPPTPAVAVAPPLLTANLTGGSEIYRITPDGYTKKITSWNTDIAYSLALSPEGKLLVGTGNGGNIFQINSENSYTNLVHSPSSQITALTSGPHSVLVAGSNGAQLYRLLPEFASHGTYVSEVFDAGLVERWGRMEWTQETPAETSIRIETRSGNSNNPAMNWSPWKEARADGRETVSQSPQSRFFQWRAVLSSKRSDVSPSLSSLKVAYLPAIVASASLR